MRRMFMTVSSRLFAWPSGPQTAGGIIKWWEVRRLYFNAILLATIFSAAAVSAATNNHGFKVGLSGPGEIIVVSIFLFLIPANIWYTGGWIVDLLIKKALRLTAPGFAPVALGAGIVFSLAFMVLIYGAFFGVFFKDLLTP